MSQNTLSKDDHTDAICCYSATCLNPKKHLLVIVIKIAVMSANYDLRGQISLFLTQIIKTPPRSVKEQKQKNKQPVTSSKLFDAIVLVLFINCK